MAAIIVTLLELPGSRMERGRWDIDKGAMLGASVDDHARKDCALDRLRCFRRDGQAYHLQIGVFHHQVHLVSALGQSLLGMLGAPVISDGL